MIDFRRFWVKVPRRSENGPFQTKTATSIAACVFQTSASKCRPDSTSERIPSKACFGRRSARVCARCGTGILGTGMWVSRLRKPCLPFRSRFSERKNGLPLSYHPTARTSVVFVADRAIFKHTYFSRGSSALSTHAILVHDKGAQHFSQYYYSIWELKTCPSQKPMR